MEIIAPINLISLASIAFAVVMVYVFNLEFDKDSAEEERRKRMKEYKRFFHL